MRLVVDEVTIGISDNRPPIAASPSITGLIPADEKYWDAITTSEPGPTFGGIKGLVRDKETGDPILGVLVSSQLYSTETDAQGYYEVPDIPAGTCKFTYTAFGYKIAERSVTIVEDEWSTIDVDLTPGEGPEPEPANLLWLWLLLGVGGAAVVVARTKKVLNKEPRG